MKKLSPLLLSLLLLTACGSNNTNPDEIKNPEIEVQVDLPNADTGTPTIPGEEPQDEGNSTETDKNAVVFELSGESFKFMMDGVKNPDLKVKKGDSVTINFTSTNGPHDWVVDEFNAATEQVQTGDSSSVTFVADKAGEFEYYCSVGSHRANGMKGKLIVE